MNESPLQRQGSVPVSGFSRELRDAADAERFWFPFALRGDTALPVHLVFSASLRTAEVKAGDLKAYRLTEVASAADARDRWVTWWKGSLRSTRCDAPRRTGRHPADA